LLNFFACLIQFDVLFLFALIQFLCFFVICFFGRPINCLTIQKIQALNESLPGLIHCACFAYKNYRNTALSNSFYTFFLITSI